LLNDPRRSDGMFSGFYQVVFATGCSAMSFLMLALSDAQAGERKVDPKLVTRPAGTTLLATDNDGQALSIGEKLFDSLQLSENGLTCKSCHYKYEAYEKSFKAPYPHAVGMAKKRAGLDQVEADEMVQLCLIVTMDSKPLDWQSSELAALTAYVLKQQREFSALPDHAD
jgi:cytochrome c peroxidase